MGATISPFLSNSYTADRNIPKQAIEQYALFLSKTSTETVEKIKERLLEYFKSDANKYQSVVAKVLIKDKNEDRQVKIIPLSKILNYVQKNNYHFSPSMVAYTNSNVEECINSIGTRSFIENRSYYKKLRQKALDLDDMELYGKYDKLQNAFKIFNNAQSGAMSSQGTPINNKSGHTTLTSTCRCLTSTANLINEQFIAGNRLYNTPENTLQSLVSRITHTDLKSLQEAMEKYKLIYPSTQDIMDIVYKSSRRYWGSDSAMAVISDFVEGLTELEKASIAYTLDIVTLYKLNNKFMNTFFDEWTTVPQSVEGELSPDNGDKYNLAISKLPAKSSKEQIAKLNKYHDQIESKYSDFIRIFFKSPIPPTCLFDVVHSVRDAVLTSDTDSSIYTVDNVIDDYTTDKVKGINLSSVLTYFIRMISVDQHQQLSANMNVALENLRLLGMKNEFYFGGYVTTLMSKHYYALQRMVEGIMRAKPEMEIKGVHLRSSKVADIIRETAEKLMERIVYAIEDKEKLDPAELLNEIADRERKVISDIDTGDFSWLSKERIKRREQYKNPVSSKWLHHDLWEHVFSHKYGKAPELPYMGIKVNMDLNNKGKLTEFINNIQDKDIKHRFNQFIEKYEKDKFTSFLIPLECIKTIGNLPEELKHGVAYREIIKQNFKSIYAVLESTGLYFINDKITKLVSDNH